MVADRPRSSGTTADGRLIVAAVLIVLALGLPWSPSTLDYQPGWITPSYCIPDSDGWLHCTPGNYVGGLTTGSGQLAGAQTVARVFLIAALLLVALARGRRGWLMAAAIVLGAGILVHGLGMLGGQVATVAAIGLLVLVARETRTEHDERRVRSG